MTRRRIVKWLAGLSGSCVILLAAAVLLLPRLLDSQAVREKIRTFLLTGANGDVTLETIDLAWFPRPVVVARGTSFAFDDTVSGTIRSIEVHPSIRGLLTGHFSISRVAVTSPVLAVRLPEPAEAPPHTDQIEGRIRSLLASLAVNCSGMTITVSDGSAEIRIGERPPLAITDVGGRLVAPPGELDVQLSSRATVFDSLRVEARIDGQTLATQARIHVENLRLRETMTSLMTGPHDHIESGAVSLKLSLSAAGLKKITAEIEGAVPSLALVRGDRKTVIKGSAFKGRISRDVALSARNWGKHRTGRRVRYWGGRESGFRGWRDRTRPVALRHRRPIGADQPLPHPQHTRRDGPVFIAGADRRPGNPGDGDADPAR
jgi:hypothetical protein